MTEPIKCGGKALICVTEDWFAYSHFVPLMQALLSIMDEVVLVTNVDRKRKQLERVGVRVVPFDFARKEMNPLHELGTVRRLARIFRKEKPDVVHLVSLKPIFVGALANMIAPVSHVAVYMTGVGFLIVSNRRVAKLVGKGVIRVVSALLSKPNSWLFIENLDDKQLLEENGASVEDRFTILGGAGIDPDHYAVEPPTGNTVLRAGFTGRMLWSKGVEDLVKGFEMARAKGVDLTLKLCGALDEGNPAAIPRDVMEGWARHEAIEWAGHIEDVREVWRECDIAVVPSVTREGMPRAMLEAAAAGRPLIVTDVTGCRHFVDHEVEGLIVQPSDPQAISEALLRLVRSPELRETMGVAAREKLMAGFTIDEFKRRTVKAYEMMLGRRLM